MVEHESRWPFRFQTSVGRPGNESIPQLDGPGGSSSEESDEGSDESDEVGVAYCIAMGTCAITLVSHFLFSGRGTV